VKAVANKVKTHVKCSQIDPKLRVKAGKSSYTSRRNIQIALLKSLSYFPNCFFKNPGYLYSLKSISFPYLQKPMNLCVSIRYYYFLTIYAFFSNGKSKGKNYLLPP